MVKRLLKTLKMEVNGLHDAAYLLATLAIVSHILALVRDRLFAHFFGAGASLDVYYAAFRIPDFIFVGIASLVSFFVIIPLILEHLNGENSVERARTMLTSIFSAFFFVIVAVSAVAFVFAPQLLDWLFPQIMSEDSGALLIRMTRILLLSPIILGMSNIFLSITQVKKRFFIYALSPVLYNIGIILGVLFLYPVFGLTGLAYGVIFGALMHVLVQIPTAREAGLMPRLSLNISWPEVLRVAKVSLPRTLALTANQAAFLALVVLAGRLTEGSIAVLNFSFNLQSVPLSIIGISYSVAAFPTLAKYYQEGAYERFTKDMISAARHILFWSFPALVLFIVLRAQIVRTALGSGEFTWDDTMLTAALVAMFVVSLSAQALTMLFARGYYAAGKTAKPFVINVVSACVTILLAVWSLDVYLTNPGLQQAFESIFRIEGIVGTGVVMLAFAYTVGMILNSVLFWIVFKIDFCKKYPARVGRTMTTSLAASIVGGIAAYWMLQVLDNIFDLNTFIGIFSQGFFAGVVGLFACALVLWAFKSEELQEAWQVMHHKFWKLGSIVKR